jgi:hypothetical protein
MGHNQIVRGRVDSIARAINVANAQPDLHLGALGAAHSGAHPHRRGTAGRRPLGRMTATVVDQYSRPRASQLKCR